VEWCLKDGSVARVTSVAWPVISTASQDGWSQVRRPVLPDGLESRIRAMRFKGTLAEWNDDRGFGFITPAEGGARVFCHISAFQERSGRPAPGKVVTYEVGRDDRGRLRAHRIRYAGKSPKPVRKPGPVPRPGWAMAISGLFVALVAGLAAGGYLSWLVLAWYLGWSGALFLVYGWDKTAAEGGRWRTKETTLNSLALIGGWPGGWIAQQAFRHKSRKISFQVEFWIAVAINVAALAWLVKSGGDPLALLER
jgi:uncharacterized membrane protein YsdA (DUF1294 family)/cold shock CspA family protein